MGTYFLLEQSKFLNFKLFSKIQRSRKFKEN